MQQWWVAPAAFMATLLALPASAGLPVGAKIILPDDPLTTASRIEPNVTFVLDNSGSMALVSMPFDVEDPEYPAKGVDTGAGRAGLKDNPNDRSYLNNTIYYDPRIDYRPWMTWDGETRMSGGQDVAAVFKDWNYADTSGGTRDLRNNAESIFYVPKSGVTAGATDPNDFDRYQVRLVAGNAKVMRGRSLGSGSWNGQTINKKGTWSKSFNVPAGVRTLTVTIGNGDGGNSDLYVRRGSMPTTTLYDGADTGSGNSHEVVIPNPASGTWYIMINNGANANTTNENVSWFADDLVEATPSEPGRTQDKELSNIATWYSYYRTRMKTAKGGAAEAFSTLDSQFRVGFTTININGKNADMSAMGDIIPVGSNKGVFDPTNKKTWFAALNGAVVQNGSTPLRKALDAVGSYYKRNDDSGPWGPAPQYSCRQNFAILTTDGYWNDSFAGAGDADGDAVAPFKGAGSNTLADVAYSYWKNDLRTDLKDNVPKSDADPAEYQHMATFTISIGLKGTLNPETDLPALQAGTKAWPDPSTSNSAKIDDLWHAAVNGHGDFVVASNPTEFAGGLLAALTSISDRASSFSNVAASSVSLDTGAQVFNASYVSGRWTGSLKAYGVDKSGVQSEQWAASVPTTGREVFTYNGTAASKTPSSSQLNLLTRTTGYPITGTENWAYLKGDQTLEKQNGGKMRNRATLLGDIVGSSPAFVKETGTLYVGGNDGMLHAFETTSGKEIFAFVPSILDWSQLGTLSASDYKHQFFVDGPVVVSSRSLTGSASAAAEKNILVGSLGRGGRGLYSLNVGAPATVVPTSIYNWEVKEKDTAGTAINMGQVLSKPILAKVPGGKNAVIVGNGVNSPSNSATLIVLDLDTGAKILEIDTNVGSSGSPNGLSAPTGVYSSDGKTVRYVFAGDIQGNVWKFDLTDGSKTKLFTAVGPGGNAQPITAGVAVAVNPLTNDRWILFGTGRYLTLEDGKATTDIQSLYGVIDKGVAFTRSDLTKRSSPTVSGSVRTFQSKDPLPSGSKGWYIDLPSNERVVQDTQMVSTFMITASMVPLGDPCEPDGEGFINALNAFTGTDAGGSYFDLNGDSTGDKAANGLPVGSIKVGNGMPTLPSILRGLIVVGGSKGSLTSPGTLKPQWDRVAWREVRSD